MKQKHGLMLLSVAISGIAAYMAMKRIQAYKQDNTNKNASDAIVFTAVAGLVVGASIMHAEHTMS